MQKDEHMTVLPEKSQHLEKPSKGVFITFEGGEGSGKSTQSRKLKELLLATPFISRRNIQVIWTREPGGSVGAEDIRSLLVKGESSRWSPITEAFLMYAARADHFENTIRPALQRGDWVICDRFYDSSIAYQGYGKGVSLELLKTLQDQILKDVTPCRTYLLDIPAEIGLFRAHARMRVSGLASCDLVSSKESIENRFENLGLEFHQEVRAGFLDIAKKESHRFCICDATLSPLEIEQKIWQDCSHHFL